jgi:2-polyprenyl-3-methyl-5-hydroxy-6-metoxy-1,4-benzoquinol methylase
MIMIPDFSTRSRRQELMDDLSLDDARLTPTFDDLARVNRLLGGYEPSLAGLKRLLGDRRRLSMLDVGTGCGDFPQRLSHWATQRGVELDLLGIDLLPTAVDCARRRCRGMTNIRFKRRDLFDFSGQARFDVVHAALMLHHLDCEQAASGLRRMYELSRLGVVVNDLHRHPLAYLGSRIALPLISRNPIIRHDGALSVLRAFRAADLYRLAEKAELPEPEVTWHFPFRWRMVIPRETR